MSKIPQFLLDAQHPWMIANQQALERLSNVESFLFSPPGTKRHPQNVVIPENSSTGTESQDPDEKHASTPRNDELIIPSDLFDNVNINNNRSSVPRAGWPNARDRLLEMKACPITVLSRVRSLHVEIRVCRGEHDDERLKAEEWQQGPTEEIFDLFTSVLAVMTALEKLTWKIPSDFAQAFKQGFTARGLKNLSVKTLEPAPFCEYMIGVCPKIEVLKTVAPISWSGTKGEEKHASLLVEAAAAAPCVKVLAVAAALTPAFILAILKSIPGLVTLELSGRIPGPPRDPDTGERLRMKKGEGFQQILSSLGQFVHLERLTLPAAGYLGYGGNESHCGNPFVRGPDAAEINYRMIRKEYEDTEKVAALTVQALPRLKQLTIDGREATITRDEIGRPRASWPWSGHLDEFLAEIMVRRRVGHEE